MNEGLGLYVVTFMGCPKCSGGKWGVYRDGMGDVQTIKGVFSTGL